MSKKSWADYTDSDEEPNTSNGVENTEGNDNDQFDYDSLPDYENDGTPESFMRNALSLFDTFKYFDKVNIKFT